MSLHISLLTGRNDELVDKSLFITEVEEKFLPPVNSMEALKHCDEILNQEPSDLVLNSQDFPGGPVAKSPSSQCREDLESFPGQGTRSHTSQLKTLYAATKTQCSQTN